MFESVKIGLSYLKDKCDAVLLTPVDIPLFTAQTVRDLMDSGAKPACPVCNGQIGHPNLIHVSLIDEFCRTAPPFSNTTTVSLFVRKFMLC